jgi:hypothetical protein
LEAGPLSQWLYAGMRDAGLAVELLETRHVRDAFKAMPVKTDRNDARGIAQLMRLGWFRPVHCKSLPAQELRAVLTARKLVQGKHHDMETSLRGILASSANQISSASRPTPWSCATPASVAGKFLWDGPPLTSRRYFGGGTWKERTNDQGDHCRARDRSGEEHLQHGRA